MLHELPANAAQLRRRLELAGPGETVQLDFGREYEGPFFLDRPIYLVGHGTATHLYGRGCPAVVVRSSGVRLENLGLSNSYAATSGICLLVAGGAQPSLVDVHLEGRMGSVTCDQLVELGELLPQRKAFTAIEIEVTEPSRLEWTESSDRWLWAGVGESFERTLPAAGRYLLRLGCDSNELGLGALVLGELRIVSTNRSHSLWITARVLAVVPPKLAMGEIALNLGNGPRLRFDDGLLIGRDRFVGFAPAEALAERQAILLKESDGQGWALIQPWTTPHPTLVGGQPLAVGARHLLSSGEMIEIGNLRLEVEPAAAAPSIIAAPAGWLDVSPMTGANGLTPFKINYRGPGKDRISVASAIPWLKVEPAELAVAQGDTHPLHLVLLTDAAKLGAGTHRERSALVLASQSEVRYLDVSICIAEARGEPNPVATLPSAQAPRLTSQDVEPQALAEWSADTFVALSAVHQDEWDRNLGGDESVGIHNPSRLPLKLTVCVEGGSGAFSVPLRFEVPPRSRGHLPVRLAPGRGEHLQLGRVEARLLLRAGTEEREVRLALVLLPPRGAPRMKAWNRSQSGSQTSGAGGPLESSRPASSPVGATWNATGGSPLMRPEIVVEPQSLDFGHVGPGRSPASLSITVCNQGVTPSVITIDRKAAWIQVSPNLPVECPAGASRIFKVDVRLGPFQKYGTAYDPRGLVLAVREHRFPISICVETTR